jgi:RimJ/RimL family protein N-acetyltransferase
LTGGAPVWAQVSAGNARSLRAFQAAGYRPVGSEALLVPGAVRHRKTPVWPSE